MSGVLNFKPRLSKSGQLCAAALALLALTACDENGQFKMPSAPEKSDSAEAASTKKTKKGKVSARDVEAPDIFEANEAALWDGRPSLGGVWVAHPDVDKPGRVRIRNETNNKVITGALFRRERDNPGPRLQLSSDAAEALEILAGSPTKIDVVALKREEIVEEVPEPTVPAPAPVEAAKVEAPAKIEAKPLDAKPKTAAPKKAKKPVDPIAAASAAIDASADTKPKPDAPAAVDTADVPPADVPQIEAPFATPYAQIGTFTDEKEAKKVVRKLRWSGAKPSITAGEINGQPFWRVIIGPAESQEKLDKLMNRAKRAGFNDVYPVQS